MQITEYWLLPNTSSISFSFFFFFNDTATTEIYPLSLHDALPICGRHFRNRRRLPAFEFVEEGELRAGYMLEDRKSTRLNSSHLVISYAVFCLKKKKNVVPAKNVTYYNEQRWLKRGNN